MSQCVIRGLSSKATVNAAAAAASKNAVPVANPSSLAEAAKNNNYIERIASKDGLKMVNVHRTTPRATLGFGVKVGSRNETYGNLGICHAVRLTAQLSSEIVSSFQKVKTLQQVGATFRATQARDYIYFSVDCEVFQLPFVMDLFYGSVLHPSYKPWEVHDLLVPQMLMDLNTRTPDVIATEALHKAAFRNQGLGNSLYITDRNLGKISSVALREFHEKNVNINNSAIVGVGFPMESMEFDNSVETPEVPIVLNKFNNDTVRVEANGDTAYIALAAEGVARGKDAMASAVLQKILGVGTSVKWGNGSGLIQKAVKAALGDAPHGVNALNYNYEDTGLIGAYLAVDSASAGKAVDATVNCLRNLKITDQQVAAAKKRIAVEMNDLTSDGVSLAESVCVDQLFGTGIYKNRVDASCSSAINSVTTAQVQAIAKKLSGKLALGATGNLENVPYADTL